MAPYQPHSLENFNLGRTILDSATNEAGVISTFNFAHFSSLTPEHGYI
jgi:hypothetical protein